MKIEGNADDSIHNYIDNHHTFNLISSFLIKKDSDDKINFNSNERGN